MRAFACGGMASLAVVGVAWAIWRPGTAPGDVSRETFGDPGAAPRSAILFATVSATLVPNTRSRLFAASASGRPEAHMANTSAGLPVFCRYWLILALATAS